MQLHSKIAIVTHQLNYGAPLALRDYLVEKKAKEVFFIGLPFYNQRNTYMQEYKNGRKILNAIRKRKVSLGTLDYVLDIFSIIFKIIQKHKYDYYVGAGSLDCFTGILLKKIGIIDKVIFYSIDFVPKRFNNFLLNDIFHKLEIFCIKNSDEIWNVSPRIAEGRKKYLNISDKIYKQIIVLIGVWNKKIKKRNFASIKKHQVLFMGHLLEKQGVQIVLDAIPLIVKKIPTFKFLVVGGGDYLKALKKQVKKLKIEPFVEFAGWVENREKIDEIMSESACAVATYMPEKNRLSNFTYYADPTKLKDYLSAGLPIILTDISYNAKEIAKRKCGILVEYNREDVANGIISLLENTSVLIKFRKNSLNYAKEFDWEKIFRKVIK